MHIGDRSIVLALDKKDKDQEYWPRLLKTTGKAPTNIKVRGAVDKGCRHGGGFTSSQVDWNKWVDEDEEDNAPDPMGNIDFASMMGGMGGMMGGMGGMGGMDLSAMGGMSGMGGEDDLDSDDEDDQEIPNLDDNA